MLLEPPATQLDLCWRMLGIPTRVHPLFWVAAFVLIFSGGRPSLLMAFVWVACVFISILVHEFGHALTARFFHARDIRVVLWMFGGFAIHSGGMKPRQNILILLMGPIAGFILAGLVFGSTWLLDYEPYYDRQESILRRTVALAVSDLLWINLWWGLINLIPIYPLDGGQVLQQALLARKPLTGAELSHRISLYLAVSLAATLFVLGLYEKFYRQLKFEYLFEILVLIALAYLNYQMARLPSGEAAGESPFQEPRKPWEQDPDWWKR